MAPPNKRRKLDDPRRRGGPQVEEIAFDVEARSEYLTGFHKRKLQRIKHAQEENAKKERALKIETRKQIRDQRKKNLEEHVQAVNAILKRSRRAEAGESSDDASSSDEATDEGAAHAEATIAGADDGRELEFVDEEKYTTVTIEPMNLSDDPDSPSDREETANGTAKGDNDADGRQKRVWTKEKPKRPKPKAKKKKFRYETKVERKANRSKQASKNSAAAQARRQSTNQ